MKRGREKRGKCKRKRKTGQRKRKGKIKDKMGSKRVK
jgi:hypothetical protein